MLDGRMDGMGLVIKGHKSSKSTSVLISTNIAFSWSKGNAVICNSPAIWVLIRRIPTAFSPSPTIYMYRHTCCCSSSVKQFDECDWPTDLLTNLPIELYWTAKMLSKALCTRMHHTGFLSANFYLPILKTTYVQTANISHDCEILLWSWLGLSIMVFADKYWEGHVPGIWWKIWLLTYQYFGHSSKVCS